MEQVIDASVADGHRGAARRARARHRHAAADADLAAAARADGRGARPPPAAALHRGRVPGGVHPARRQDPPARAGPLRDHARPGAAPHDRRAARSPPATTASPSTSSTCSTTTGARADLLAPGHPLHDAVTDETIARWQRTLDRGTVLVSPTLEEPRLLVGVIEEIVDATETAVARRFGYAYIDEHGSVEAAGPAPYLDCVAAPADERGHRGPRRCRGSPRPRTRRRAGSSPTSSRSSSSEVKLRREAELDRVRDQVDAAPRPGERPARRSRRWSPRRRSRPARSPRRATTSLIRKAADLDGRRTQRLALLDRQLEMQAKPPRVVTAALVLPLAAVEAEIPDDAPMHAVETKEVERRGVDLVLARRARARPQPGRAGVQQPRLRHPLHAATATTRSGSRSRPASPAPRTSSSPTTRC